MPPFWLAVPEIPGWAASEDATGQQTFADPEGGACHVRRPPGLQAYGWAAGSLEAWSSSGSGDGNSGEAGARRLQPAHLLQVAVQTEKANRQRPDQARVDVAAAQFGHGFEVNAVTAGDKGPPG